VRSQPSAPSIPAVDRFGDRPQLARRVATARLGIAYAQAFVDFWTDIAEHPPEVTPSD
jgi:hypothetical protein